MSENGPPHEPIDAIFERGGVCHNAGLAIVTNRRTEFFR